MPVPYNVTQVFNNTTSSLPDILGVVNTASGNIFGMGILLAIFIIMYVINISNNQTTPTSLGVASIITAISSVFLARVGLVTPDFVAVTVVISVVALAWLWWSRGVKSTY